jgi:hypothetical protein
VAGTAGDELFGLHGLALGAGGSFVAEDQLLEGAVAGFAVIFVDRHGKTAP